MRHATPRNARAACCLSDMRAMVASTKISGSHIGLFRVPVAVTFAVITPGCPALGRASGL